ncbi:uncharacterized protein LOC117652712 [Thrips palmi]|uniref:Uncharacterized protein LOC117652712 n=1 Tax=Thrips palmi TaxID=161013 RepID=A0A6P9A816_THRPL|nr:uncharacterized protein LOC117652712 [Thrips palmi]
MRGPSPVAGFENSAMKNSFSLSSLQPHSGFPESPERARLRLERPYNSLTKKSRRDPEQEGWRRSWGSHNKDEFWAALQSDYDYLMDNNLIDTCKEASGDLSVYNHAASSDGDWSFNQFTAHFLELYSWLNSIQEAVYGKEETVTDRGLRTSHMERMQREGFRRRMFNEQSTRLLVRYPDLRDEVAWRVAHLNSKWETLELAMSPSIGTSSQRDMCTDVEHEVRCLRKWVREMEARLQPLDFRAGINWTYAELEQRAKEHMVLQRDVESHGKIVSSVVKLCERVAHLQQLQHKQVHQDAEDAEPRPRQQDLVRVARRLERRWHHLFLRSLEWQCHLETLATKLPQPAPSQSDSDEGPASKQPRLSLSHDEDLPRQGRDQRDQRGLPDQGAAAAGLMDSAQQRQQRQQLRNMVGASTGIKATIKRRRKQGGRPRGSPLDQSPNVAYYQFRYTDMDSDRQEHPGNSDHADDLSLEDDDEDLLDHDEDLLDLPHDIAHDDDNNNNNRRHLLSTTSAGSLSDLALSRPTEASASDSDEEWTYHAQGHGNGTMNGNLNGNLNGGRHFSETRSASSAW